MNNPPTLVRGSSQRKVNGKVETLAYSYMARAATIWDEALIAWAERREAELRRKHEALQRHV